MTEWFESVVTSYSRLPDLARSVVWIAFAGGVLVLYVIGVTPRTLNEERQGKGRWARNVRAVCICLFCVCTVIFCVVNSSSLVLFPNGRLIGKRIGADVLLVLAVLAWFGITWALRDRRV